MEQQPAAPSLVTLPDNILQEIASRLDGLSLVQVLCTCQGLHSNHALKACLLEAVQQQLAALQRALQIMPEAVAAADVLRAQSECVRVALPTSQPRLLLQSIVLSVMTTETLKGIMAQEPAVEQLELARGMLRDARAMGHAVGQLGQELGQGQGQLGQELGPTVVQARQRAVHALQAGAALQQQLQANERRIHYQPPAAQPRPLQLAAQQQLQVAVHAVVAGQPNAEHMLQTLVKVWAHKLKQQARDTLQAYAQAGWMALRLQAGNADMSTLRAAVQGAQAALQRIAGEGRRAMFPGL